jgi:hypothetical protein
MPGGKMPKVRLTLHSLVKEIEKIEKELRKIRKSVSAADKKKINLELKALRKVDAILREHCLAYIQRFEMPT